MGKPTCQYRVFTGARDDVGGHLCTRNAKHTDSNGRPVCGMHTDEAVAKRRDAFNARVRKYIDDSDARCKAEQEMHRKAAAHDGLLERNRELTRQVEQLMARVDAAEKLANQWAITRDYMMNQCSKSLRAALTAPPSSSDPGRADTGREET